MTARFPGRELDEHVEALRRRLTREHRAATPAEMAKLRAFWEAADQSHRWDVEHPEAFDCFYGASPPPGWELLEAEFAPVGEPETGAGRYELLRGPLSEGLEPDPYSDPDPIEEELFDGVIRRLGEAEPLRSIERETGLSIRQVAKVRDYQHHPNRLGPNGSDGYALYRQPSRPGTIFLRKLRAVRL